VPELDPSLVDADKAAIESDDLIPAGYLGNLSPDDDEAVELPVVGNIVISPRLVLLRFGKSSKLLLIFSGRANICGTTVGLV
jgi:hypothetical protein